MFRRLYIGNLSGNAYALDHKGNPIPYPKLGVIGMPKAMNKHKTPFSFVLHTKENNVSSD